MYSSCWHHGYATFQRRDFLWGYPANDKWRDAVRLNNLQGMVLESRTKYITKVENIIESDFQFCLLLLLSNVWEVISLDGRNNFPASAKNSVGRPCVWGETPPKKKSAKWGYPGWPKQWQGGEGRSKIFVWCDTKVPPPMWDSSKLCFFKRQCKMYVRFSCFFS